MMVHSIAFHSFRSISFSFYFYFFFFFFLFAPRYDREAAVNRADVVQTLSPRFHEDVRLTETKTNTVCSTRWRRKFFHYVLLLFPFSMRRRSHMILSFRNWQDGRGRVDSCHATVQIPLALRNICIRLIKIVDLYIF